MSAELQDASATICELVGCLQRTPAESISQSRLAKILLQVTLGREVIEGQLQALEQELRATEEREKILVSQIACMQAEKKRQEETFKQHRELWKSEQEATLKTQLKELQTKLNTDLQKKDERIASLENQLNQKSAELQQSLSNINRPLGPKGNGCARDVKDEPDSDVEIVETRPINTQILPPGRLQDLSHFPVVNVHVRCKGPKFTRELLRLRLGGSCQPTLVKITKTQRPLAARHNINEYWAPNANQNPWVPSRPGQHGYMNIGLTTDAALFMEETGPVPLFVSRPGPKKKLVVQYMGDYTGLRVDPLSVVEWKGLSEEVRSEYCKTTKNREASQSSDTSSQSSVDTSQSSDTSQSLDTIHEDYNLGHRQMPCVRLVCKGFNLDLYNALVDALVDPHAIPVDTSPSSNSLKRKASERMDKGTTSTSKVLRTT